MPGCQVVLPTTVIFGDPNIAAEGVQLEPEPVVAVEPEPAVAVEPEPVMAVEPELEPAVAVEPELEPAEEPDELSEPACKRLPMEALIAEVGGTTHAQGMTTRYEDLSSRIPPATQPILLDMFTSGLQFMEVSKVQMVHDCTSLDLISDRCDHLKTAVLEDRARLVEKHATVPGQRELLLQNLEVALLPGTHSSSGMSYNLINLRLDEAEEERQSAADRLGPGA